VLRAAQTGGAGFRYDLIQLRGRQQGAGRQRPELYAGARVRAAAKGRGNLQLAATRDLAVFSATINSVIEHACPLQLTACAGQVIDGL
jgi:hypothetical protein